MTQLLNARPHIEVKDVMRSADFNERALGMRIRDKMGVDVVNELQDHPWGMRNFVVRDPDGHLIAIGERVVAR